MLYFFVHAGMMRHVVYVRFNSKFNVTCDSLRLTTDDGWERQKTSFCVDFDLNINCLELLLETSFQLLHDDESPNKSSLH